MNRNIKKDAKVELHGANGYVQSHAPAFITGDVHNAGDLAVVRIDFLKAIVRQIPVEDLGAFKERLKYQIEEAGDYTELSDKLESMFNQVDIIRAINDHVVPEGGLTAADDDIL